nr:hypothetical protein [Mycoplasmopsis bovis]
MFRSPGKDYNKLFGNYNLPQYDLIYGGGKDQKNSYRQALEAKYKFNEWNTLKPNYFRKRLSRKINVPKEFRFKNSQPNNPIK